MTNDKSGITLGFCLGLLLVFGILALFVSALLGISLFW